MRIVTVAASLSLLALGAWVNPSAHRQSTPRESASAAAAQATVTIETPADGTNTSARSIAVRGGVPPEPEDGYTVVTVTVNRRPVEPKVRGSVYRTEVALELGGNEITAKAEIYSDGDSVEVEPETITSAPSVVTRTSAPGDGTGTLDRATAYAVSDSSRQVYWLCGEGDECRTDVRCFEITRRRVDCPVGSSWRQRAFRCGVVVTVRLRRERVYFAGYRCRGRFRPQPQRFIKRRVWRDGRRFRVDEDEHDWLREEINLPNRYGAPRFDVDRDVFIP